MLKKNKLLISLNHPFSISERPFQERAKDLRISEGQLLSILKRYRKSGLIRRFGAVLSHRQIGLKTNALIAWQVEKEKLNRVAGIIGAYPEVTHCYLRSSYPSWPYNLYTMVHAGDKNACLKLVKLFSKKTKVESFRVLFTVKEFKKTRAELKNILK